MEEEEQQEVAEEEMLTMVVVTRCDAYNAIVKRIISYVARWWWLLHRDGHDYSGGGYSVRCLQCDCGEDDLVRRMIAVVTTRRWSRLRRNPSKSSPIEEED